MPLLAKPQKNTPVSTRHGGSTLYCLHFVSCLLCFLFLEAAVCLCQLMMTDRLTSLTCLPFDITVLKKAYPDKSKQTEQVLSPKKQAGKCLFFSLNERKKCKGEPAE